MAINNPLEAAIKAAKIGRKHLPAKASETDETKTVNFKCSACGAMNSVTAEDDESYRTDESAGETGGDSDDDNTDEDGDDEFEDRVTKLAARLLKAAKQNPNKANSNTSKAAALKQKYRDRKLNAVDQILIGRGFDPFEED
jgi:hypothetical protein